MILKESKADLKQQQPASALEPFQTNLVDQGQVFTNVDVAENSFDAILHFNQDMKIFLKTWEFDPGAERFLRGTC